MVWFPQLCKFNRRSLVSSFRPELEFLILRPWGSAEPAWPIWLSSSCAFCMNRYCSVQGAFLFMTCSSYYSSRFTCLDSWMKQTSVIKCLQMSTVIILASLSLQTSGLVFLFEIQQRWLLCFCVQSDAAAPETPVLPPCLRRNGGHNLRHVRC